MTAPITLKACSERFPLANPFVISRGTKTEAVVVIAEVLDDMGHRGRGEAVPYARYGETVEAALDQIRAYAGPLDRIALQRSMPPGAARNAIDCALWDLEAKRTSRTVHEIAGVNAVAKVETAYTISLASPCEMAQAASMATHLNLLKLKLGGAGDGERIAAVRAARPDARLIADANEAWSNELLEPLMAAASAHGVALIEQPLPAGADRALASITRAVPVCADESAHTSADLDDLRDRYDAVNIKLDKAGGLTEALVMAERARSLGLAIMIGSMVATSLAAAPALILATHADWVDLDGPLLLARDREHGLDIRNGWIAPASSELWG